MRIEQKCKKSALGFLVYIEESLECINTYELWGGNKFSRSLL